MDKELLFKPRITERDVEVDGIGVVRVRALSRAEATRFKGKHDVEILERQMLAVALVDPKLTEDEVARWQEVAPAGELQVVVDTIVELSGMKKDVGKQNYADFRDDT